MQTMIQIMIEKDVIVIGGGTGRGTEIKEAEVEKEGGALTENDAGNDLDLIAMMNGDSDLTLLPVIAEAREMAAMKMPAMSQEVKRGETEMKNAILIGLLWLLLQRSLLEDCPRKQSKMICTRH